MIQTNFASRLKALYARLRSVDNVRGTQGSLKKWSESLNKCEKSGRKRSTLCFVAVIMQPGNVLKEVDT